MNINHLQSRTIRRLSEVHQTRNIRVERIGFRLRTTILSRFKLIVALVYGDGDYLITSTQNIKGVI